jgi:putative (di)nucleoside polyphosphate hydrolase
MSAIIWKKHSKKERIMKPLSQYFRAGVGAVIIDDGGRLLVLERSDILGSWQLPQGGLEEGEEPSKAVLREINEETGISQNDLELIDKYPEPLVYELPPDARSRKTGRGQVQYWFLFRFKGDESDIDIISSDEFTAWRWMSVKQLLYDLVDFRARVYRLLTKRFSVPLLLE